jgi:hypothetical protein
VTVKRGLEWGDNVANQVFAGRATDGFSNPVPPFNCTGAVIGQWQSAAAASMSPGNISFTTPFVMTATRGSGRPSAAHWPPQERGLRRELQRAGDDGREDRLPPRLPTTSWPTPPDPGGQRGLRSGLEISGIPGEEG